jgi:hypothetical protein
MFEDDDNFDWDLDCDNPTQSISKNDQLKESSPKRAFEQVILKLSLFPTKEFSVYFSLYIVLRNYFGIFYTEYIFLSFDSSHPLSHFKINKVNVTGRKRSKTN